MGNQQSQSQAFNIGLKLCGAAVEAYTNGLEAPNVNGAPGGAPIHQPDSGIQTRMILLSLDYPGTGNELTCTEDGKNMSNLARSCGATDVTYLTNNECNYDQVEQTIREVGARCNPGDFFVFFYSGHGTSVPDKDGDEEDGKDEALCLVTPQGKLDWSRFMTDDQFAEIVTENVSSEVKIIILADCCHSGTIGDLHDSCWDGYEAVSLSGCMDSQTSGDTGRGGIFTHSLLMAIEDMQKKEDDDYSVAELYNLQLTKDNSVFDSEQAITMKWSSSLDGPQDMAWPLIPETDYSAPW